MTADSDLPWYFGTADKTMSGDLGLRSSMGGQLAAAESCMYYDEQGHEHGGQLAERSFTNEAEGAMFQRLRYAADAKRIEASFNWFYFNQTPRYLTNYAAPFARR